MAPPTDGIIKSSYPDVHIPSNVSFPDFVLQQISSHGEKTALVDAQTRRHFTYADIICMTASLKSALYKLGVRPRDVVCLSTPNIIEYPVIILAVTSLGAAVNPANPNYTARELKKQLMISKAKLVITANDKLAIMKKACVDTLVQKVIPVDDRPGCLSLRQLLKEDASPVPGVKIRSHSDVALLPFSSGTTGLPKGVMLTHFNLVANLCQAKNREFEYYRHEDIFVTFLPFFHVYGLMVIMMLGLCVGVTNVVMSKFDLRQYLQAIQDYRATVVGIVPPIALLLAQSEIVKEYDLSSIETLWSGAAPLTLSVLEQLRKRLGRITVRQGYGMTEASPMVISSPPRNIKDGSIGVLIPNTQAKVVDPSSGEILGPNERGEILIKGPQVMKGYHNMPQETHKIIENGWLHTGDIGYYDEDGNFYTVDRVKELIKYKGFQVAPAELEDLLLQHKGVKDCAVIGIAHPQYGEVPTAFVVRFPNAVVTTQELEMFVRGQVAPYKQLRGGIHFLDSIPKSPTGKILRRLLKEKFQSKL